MDGTEANGAAARPNEVTTRHVLLAFLGVVAALGFSTTYLQVFRIAEPQALQVGSTLLFSLLSFTWFWLDSEARAYKRSPWLSLAVVAIAALAIPYYLLRSRPKGRRFKALGKCLGFAVLIVIAFVLGSLPMALLA